MSYVGTSAHNSVLYFGRSEYEPGNLARNSAVNNDEIIRDGEVDEIGNIDDDDDDNDDDAMNSFGYTCELEEFAEALDKWITAHPKDDEGTVIEEELASAMLCELEKIAMDRASCVMADNSVSGQKNFSTLAAEDQLYWLEEAYTWSLVNTILPYRVGERGDKFQQTKHEYLQRRQSSTEGSDIWELFLFQDDNAREIQAILKWLEQVASVEETEEDILISQLEKCLSIKDCTWPRGWLHTRENLFKQKRLQNMVGRFSQSFNKKELTGTAGFNSTITQLDPDAPSRLNGNLDKVDNEAEKLFWIYTYKFLRQGHNWQDICEWFEERNEMWRSVSLGVSSTERRSRICVDGPDVGALWRRVCYAAAANDSAVCKYETACYGLLGGNIKSVDMVSSTWKDLLYSRLNAQLIWQFDNFLLKNYKDRVNGSELKRLDRPEYKDNDWCEAASIIIEQVLRHDHLREEGVIRTVQASLIGNYFPKLACQIGKAIAKRAGKDSRYPYVITTGEGVTQENGNESDDVTNEDGLEIQRIVEDCNAIRVVLHLLILFRTINCGNGNSSNNLDEEVNFDNVLMYYIEILSAEGKFELIPTYARYLTRERAYKVTGMILLEVNEVGDKVILGNLIIKNGLSLAEIVKNLWQYCLRLLETSELAVGGPIKSIDLVEVCSEAASLYRIRKNLRQSSPTPIEELCIRSLEWFILLRGKWEYFFEGYTEVMVKFLELGCLDAALDMQSRLSIKEVSCQKTPYYFEESIDITSQDPEKLSSMVIGNDLTAENVAQVFREQARVSIELEQLVCWLRCIMEWSNVEGEMLEKQIGNGSIDKKKVEEAIERVVMLVQPLLKGFLVKIPAESILRLGRNIRNEMGNVVKAYIPDVVRAYQIAVLNASAVIGPKYLAKLIAIPVEFGAKANDEMVQCIKSGHRLGYMVHWFTYTNMIFLKLREIQHQKDGLADKIMREDGHAPQDGGSGGKLEIWDVNRVF